MFILSIDPNRTLFEISIHCPQTYVVHIAEALPYSKCLCITYGFYFFKKVYKSAIKPLSRMQSIKHILIVIQSQKLAPNTKTRFFYISSWYLLINILNIQNYYQIYFCKLSTSERHIISHVNHSSSSPLQFFLHLVSCLLQLQHETAVQSQFIICFKVAGILHTEKRRLWLYLDITSSQH